MSRYFYNNPRDRRVRLKRASLAPLPVDKLREKARGFMGVRVRQKIKGKGNPWWVFISHNGKRASRKVGDKKAAEKVAIRKQPRRWPARSG